MNKPSPGSYKYYLIVSDQGHLYDQDDEEFIPFAEDATHYTSLEEAKQAVFYDDLTGCRVREITVTERIVG